MTERTHSAGQGPTELRRVGASPPGLALTDQPLPCRVNHMRVWRMAPMFFATAILLLQGGDCVSLLLADQATKQCCTRGKCSPSKKADPCCQSSNSGSIQHFQPESKSSPIVISVIMPVDVDHNDLLDASNIEMGRLTEHSFHSPPDWQAHSSLPLLI